MTNKKRTVIMFVITLCFIALLSGGCSIRLKLNSKPTKTTPTNQTTTTKNDTAEPKEETIISDRPAFAQVDWTKYMVRSDDIQVFGKPGSSLTLDDIVDIYPSGNACLRESCFTAINKLSFHEVDDYLRVTHIEGKDDLSFYLGVGGDLDLKDSNGSVVSIDFPIYGKDVLLSTAINSNCWALKLFKSIPTSGELRPIGIDKVETSYRKEFGVDPYYYAQMFTSFMEQNGAPTGLLYDSKRREFFDPEYYLAGSKYTTIYILYWERSNYVVAIPVMELVDENNAWGIRLEDAYIFYTKSAWNAILKSQMNPVKYDYPLYTQVLFNDFGGLIERANNITNIYAQSK